MNVLIVDDSIVFRSAIRQAIDGVDGINVLATAIHGAQALEKINSMPVETVIIDLEMPVMDGIETIKEIRKQSKTINIIVFSAFSQAGAQKTLDALAAGAQDFLAKSGGDDDASDGIEEIRSTLAPKILQFKNLALKGSSVGTQVETKSLKEQVLASSRLSEDQIFAMFPKAICIGSSTGGPEALKQLFQGITTAPGLPILVTQHMPPMFTKQLANMLDQQTSVVSVKEAENGEEILPNIAYIAPGDFHMEFIERDGKKFVDLKQTEKVNSVRPAVDNMIWSASKYYPCMLNFILTGMGEDGLDACRDQKALGNPVLIQNEETCIVFGMPGAIDREKLQDVEASVQDLSKYINKQWR